MFNRLKKHFIAIVLVLIITISIQIFKDSNIFAAWIFSFISEWTPIFGAIITLILAYAAFASIKEIQKERKRLRNYSWMKKIRDWAESLIEFSKQRLPFNSSSELLDLARDWALVVIETPSIVLLSQDILEKYEDKELVKLVNEVANEVYKMNRAFDEACNRPISAQSNADIESIRIEFDKLLWRLLSAINIRESILS